MEEPVSVKIAVLSSQGNYLGSQISNINNKASALMAAAGALVAAMISRSEFGHSAWPFNLIPWVDYRYLAFAFLIISIAVSSYALLSFRPRKNDWLSLMWRDSPTDQVIDRFHAMTDEDTIREWIRNQMVVTQIVNWKANLTNISSFLFLFGVLASLAAIAR